jgi:hemolysin III
MTLVLKRIKTGISKEEVFNSVTHGIGLILASAGLLFLVFTGKDNELAPVVVYGVTLVLLYLTSTLYHLIRHSRTKSLFRVLDHIGIFLLIAGTYTPFCAIALKGSMGTILLIAIWVLAVAGLVLKLFFTGRYDVLSVLLYLGMGWLVIMVLKPVYDALPLESFLFLIIGGVSYSSGVLFYRMSSLRYHHGIWHIFVLGGSISHFVSVWSLIHHSMVG